MSGFKRLLSLRRIILTTEKVLSASAEPVIETKIVIVKVQESCKKVVMNQGQGDPEKIFHFSFYVVKAI